MCSNCDNNNISPTEECLSISFSCIFRVNQKFFLLLEIESEVEGIDFDKVIIIRITKAQAEALRDCGIGSCRILTEEPSSTRAEFVCVFIEDGQAFLIFDLETEPEEVVLVRVTLEEAQRRIGLGQRRCCVINHC